MSVDKRLSDLFYDAPKPRFEALTGQTYRPIKDFEEAAIDDASDWLQDEGLGGMCSAAALGRDFIARIPDKEDR